MVKAGPFRPSFLIALCVALVQPAKALTDYKIGDIAREDIVAPAAIEIIDAEATAARKESEALRTPAIFRVYWQATNEVENRFVRALAAGRSNFAAGLAVAFHPIPLEPQVLASSKFSDFVAAFNATSAIPLTTNLAAAWATGNRGADFETAYVDRLRQAMRRPIREDRLPAGLSLSDTARLAPIQDPAETVTLEETAQQGRIVTQASIATLSRARVLLRREFPDHERALADAMAGFLAPDCAIDVELTRQARARQVEGLVVAQHYDVGQLIVARGQRISAKAEAALVALGEKEELDHLQRKVAEQDIRARQMDNRAECLVTGMVVAVALLLLTIWRLRRRRHSSTLLPAILGPSGLVPGIQTPDPWQRRVWEAEQRQERARAALFSGLQPGLLRLLGSRLVQGLIRRRADMRDTQYMAAREITALDARLNELQALLQERLRAYENRIGQLENELSKMSEENRELLKTRIQKAREQMEARSAKPGPRFN